MPDVGYASMPVIPTFKGLQGDLERGSSKALSAAGVSGGAKFGASASKSARGKFSASAKSIVAPLLGAFTAVKVADFFKDAVSGASDLAESTNKVQQVFGKGTGAVFKFTNGAAKAIGQTNQQARDAAATFGIFGKAAKFTDKQNAKFSIRMTRLASDLASFHNTSPEQAIEAIGAAMRGEAEPIRSYGVLLDDATLKAEALRLGILKPVKDKGKILSAQAKVIDSQAKYNEAVKKNGKDSIEAYKANGALVTAQSSLGKAVQGTVPPLTQQQKVIAAQSSIMKQSKVAQGDFARTSGGLANQQRILSARWTDAKAALGTALLPMVNKAVKYLNDEGIPAFERFADFFTEKGIPAIQKFGRKAEPVIRDVIGKARDFLKEAQPYAEGFVEAFNKLPKGVKTGVGAAALLGVGASKIPGVGDLAGSAKDAAIGKAKDLLTGAFSKTKPMPVFVVNEGFGGAGGRRAGGRAAAEGGAAGLATRVATHPATLLLGPAAAAAIGAAAAEKVSVGKGKAFSQREFANLAGANAGSASGGQMASPFKPSDFDDEKPKRLAEALNKASFYSNLTRQNINKLPSDLVRGMNGAEALKSQVFGIESSTKRSRAAVVSLIDALEAARQKAVKVEQAVSVARQSKVDRQLGGGMYVANMNVHGTSLPEVRRDADHQRRARAHGAESFR